MSGIEKEHIKCADIGALLYDQNLPLILYFLVISPQAVNAFDVDQIVSFQFARQPLILWAIKILAGLFVR